MTKTVPQTEKQKPVDLSGMRVLVVGLARTGIAVARFLTHRGARVMGSDSRSRHELEKEFPELGQLDIDFFREARGDEVFGRADLVILSPGVPPSIEPLIVTRQRNIPIVSEIELASWYLTIPIIAVTGTNGKTTTTLLVGEMLRRAGKQVFVGGNIGNPLINLVERAEHADTAVVELSSFQLETIQRFRPSVAVLLNITEDHLDRYPTFDAYVESKSRLFMNQRVSDLSVLNASDPNVTRAAQISRARKIYFNIGMDGPEGAFFDGDQIVLRESHGEELYDPKRGRLLGTHNIENMMAAILTAKSHHCSSESVRHVMQTFEGLAHRLEFVCEFDGVRYFNDSKGTNVGAVIRSLEAFSGPVVLIAGGKDKGGDYSPLRTPLRERAKHLILIGEARARMNRELSGATPVTLADSLQAAVEKAHSVARPGDTVLLSPACSSYDMFRDYVERGDTFKTLVRRLAHTDEKQRAVR
jgi:UDP-N-acetylmuramoylalanine--D-glutamate ligase